MSNGLDEVQFKAARLSDQVKGALKKGIEEGTFKVGETLPTVEMIAAHFHVSKVTVREALRGLEGEDLIETKKGASGGIYVTQPTVDRVRDSVLHAWNFGGLSPAELTEFRQFTEPGIAELAAMRRTDEDIEALRANLDYCEKAMEDEGRIELSKHLEFHRLLANACHNRLISSFMEAVTKVHEEIFRQLPLNLAVGIEDLEYNRKFIDCLVNRDKERIRRLMRTHFDIFKEHFEGISDAENSQRRADPGGAKTPSNKKSNKETDRVIG
jgi:GntR family transcriptional repressor for pyruvate dehydrogenase complex